MTTYINIRYYYSIAGSSFVLASSPLVVLFLALENHSCIFLCFM